MPESGISRSMTAPADSGRHQEDVMARRRYQRGQLSLRGKEKLWVARWREDVIRLDGSIHRVRKCEVIGTLKEFKTRRLAERELEQRLSEVNSLNYTPRPTATFAQFAAKWEKDVLTLHKPSTGSADRSRIRKHLLPELGKFCMKDISTAHVQSLIAKKSAERLSAKSIHNLVALLSEMWRSAKAWGFLPAAMLLDFDSLVEAEPGLRQERFLTLEEMQRIIEAAPEPLRTFFWILSETGLRAGEIGGLPVFNLQLDLGAIKISQSVWHGKIQTVKSRKGNRTCEIIKYRSLPGKDPLHVPAQRPYKGGDDDHKQHVLNCAVEIHQPYSGAVRPRRRQNNYRIPERAMCPLALLETF
jgi:integrase